jgi:hypothetical protein
MAALMLSGCAMTPDIPDRPASKPRPTAPVMSRGDMIYTGPIDQETLGGYLPVDGEHRTNAIGEPQFVSIDKAMRAYGEHSVRKFIAHTVNLCYKVEVQRWAAAEAEAQAAWVQDAQEKTHRAIKTGEVVGDVLSAGSAGTGFAVPGAGWAWNALNLFSAAQGFNNNHMWSLAMDQTDRLNDLNITLVHLFLGNEDLYLDSMQDWCGQYEDWVQRHGSFGHDDHPAWRTWEPTQSPAPQQAPSSSSVPATPHRNRYNHH